MAAGGVAAATIPLAKSTGIANDIVVGRPITVDLSLIPEGSAIKILANRTPVIIRHRAQWEIDTARNVDISTLPHPETDEDRLRPRPDGTLDPRFLILSAVCTHFGAIVTGEQNKKDPMGDYGGWYCPSHGAHFDTSGRVRKGPSPTNLPIPEFKYVTENIVEFPNHKFIRR